MFKIGCKTDHSPQARVKFVPNMLRSRHPVLSQRQSTLNRVENVLDWAVHWVVVRTEDTSVASDVDGLLDQDVSMRVEIVHCENIKIIRRPGANTLQNPTNKGKETHDCRAAFAPGLNPSSGRAPWLWIFSTDRAENIQFLTVPVGADLAHSPTEMGLASAAI